MRARDPDDPKGLIREAYRIEGITAGECRSIFLDWAMGLSDPEQARPVIRALLERYAQGAADHPMTQTLRAGLDDAGPARRRGGRAGRFSD
ncbi:hypothetical protein [Yoonia sp.]|uniref:hypothetical protein n=1 Tax=Yoonia sp. TaxID=2212373 RepID=UPI003F6D1F18